MWKAGDCPYFLKHELEELPVPRADQLLTNLVDPHGVRLARPNINYTDPHKMRRFGFLS